MESGGASDEAVADEEDEESIVGGEDSHATCKEKELLSS